MTARPGNLQAASCPQGKEGTRNPFPGPQAYARDEQVFFFGRGEEIEEIVSLILSSSTTLLYGSSGTGKSSLLQAGLAPHLEEKFNFVVLPTVRLGTGGRTGAPNDGSNPFIRAMCEGISGDAFDDEVHPEAIDTIVFSRRPENSRRALLIVDQFEEVFNDPTLWKQRDEFFIALTRTLQNNTWLRAIIAIRSDYVADLVPHEANLPGRLMIRYQLESLTEEQVTEAVSSAFVVSGVELAHEDLSKLLDLLLKYSVGRSMRARHVNAIQLQIVCRRLWEILRHQNALTPVLARDSAFSVRRSMVQFVDEAIANTVTNTDADEALVRWWLGSQLITSTGRRAFILIEDGQTSGLPNLVIDKLAEERLLQFEQRHGSRLGELTHDSMVDAVRDSNKAWLQLQRGKRMRTFALLFILLVALIAAFPLLRVSQQQDILVEARGDIEREVQIPFSGAGQGAVVKLNVSPGSLPITIRVVERSGSVPDTVVAKTVLNSDNSKDFLNSSLAVRTNANLDYAVILDVPHSREVRRYLATVNPIPTILTDEGPATEISDSRVGILLKPEEEQVISVEHGSLEGVTGVDVLASTAWWAIVKGTPDRSIAVLTTNANGFTEAEGHVTVHRQAVPPSAEIAINQPVDVVASPWVFRSFTLKESKPLAADVSCDGAVVVSLLGSTGKLNWRSNYPQYLGDTLAPGKHVLPLNVDTGQHRLVLSSSSINPVKCQLGVRAFDMPPVTTFGSHDFVLPYGAPAAAYAIAAPVDAVLIAEPPDTLFIAVHCSTPSGPQASTKLEHYLAYIPRGSSCVLWLTRSDASVKASASLPVWIAQAAQTGGG